MSEIFEIFEIGPSSNLQEICINNYAANDVDDNNFCKQSGLNASIFEGQECDEVCHIFEQIEQRSAQSKFSDHFFNVISSKSNFFDYFEDKIEQIEQRSAQSKFSDHFFNVISSKSNFFDYFEDKIEQIEQRSAQSKFSDHFLNVISSKSNFFDYLEDKAEQDLTQEFFDSYIRYFGEQVKEIALDSKYLAVSTVSSMLFEKFVQSFINVQGTILNNCIKFCAKSFGTAASNLFYNVENFLFGSVFKLDSYLDTPYNNLLSKQAALSFAIKGISKVMFIELLGINKNNIPMKMTSTFLSGVVPNLIIKYGIGMDKVAQKIIYSSVLESLKFCSKKFLAPKEIFQKASSVMAIKIFTKLFTKQMSKILA